MYSVLVIEDDEITLEIIVKCINKDFIVYEANSAESGYQKYLDIKPDIIICDLNLPLMDGIELLKKIRVHDKNVRMIISSSKSDIQTFLDASELGLSKYLIKPISKEKITLALNESIEQLKNYRTVNLQKIEIANNIIWDKDKFELIQDGTIIELSPKEKMMLNYLLKKPNTTRTYEEILANVWEYESVDKTSLKTTATNIRKKIPSLELKNIYGIGYCINIPK